MAYIVSAVSPAKAFVSIPIRPTQFSMLLQQAITTSVWAPYVTTVPPAGQNIQESGPKTIGRRGPHRQHPLAFLREPAAARVHYHGYQ
jgi:hypothetical protein